MIPSGRRCIASLLAVGLLCAAACARKPPSYHGVPLSPNVTCATPDCAAYNVQPWVRIQTKYGTGCLGNVSPGTTPDPIPPPLSYLASDVGKLDVPVLKASESKQLRAIERYVHSKTLRIAWVTGGREGYEFIIFDATDGPCETWAGGYKVLNQSCNEFYQPGENPYYTHAGSTGFPCKPHPWEHTGA